MRCRHCGLEIKYDIGNVWRHQPSKYITCAFANPESHRYTATEAEPYSNNEILKAIKLEISKGVS